MDRLVAAIADAELIVDSSPIPHNVPAVEQKDLRRAPRAEFVGDLGAQIAKDREPDFMHPLKLF